MLKTGKRNFDEFSDLRKPSGMKKKKYEATITKEFIVSDSLKTDIITPDSIIDLENTETLFAKRITRQLDGNAKIYLPDISSEETRIFLSIVQEMYQETSLKDDVKKKKPRELTTKERKLESVFKYLSQGFYSCNMISKLTGVSTNKVKSLLKRIKKHKRILPSTIRKTRNLSANHIEFLTNIMNTTHGTQITLNYIKTSLINKFEDLNDISLSTISDTLKRIGFSFKRTYKYPERRNIDQTKELRNKVVQLLVYSLFEEYEIIFIDETSIHLNLTRLYGWAQKGQKLSLPVPPQSKNYSVITAISASKVLGCQVIRGSVKQEDYLSFICGIVRQYNYMRNSNGVIIFADNASVHTAGAVKSSLDSKVTLLYNAPHSPMLNPIEEFFAQFKYLLQKRSTKTEQELIVSIQEVLATFDNNQIKAYIRHTLSFVEPSLNYEDII